MDYEKRFDDYVAYQASNRMAKQVLRMLVEEKQDKIPSPILLIGNSGTGKSYLTNAVLEGYRKMHPEKHVISLDGETFAEKLVVGSGDGEREEAARFKAECRNRES